MAVVKIALRQRETLAVLRVRDDAILLQTMLWPDEVRTPQLQNLDADIELRPQELKMAASLIDSMVADFDPEEFTDSYKEAVQTMVDNKLDSGSSKKTPEPKESTDDSGGEVIDLLTALQRSVDRAKGGGLSTLFGGGVQSSLSGSTVVEKNLDRLTYFVVGIWVVCIVGVALSIKYGV
jgi:DNA end-binding protein Ku